MPLRLLRAGLILSAVFLAGCDETVKEVAQVASKDLSPQLVSQMKTHDMTPASPMMVRIFKEEGKLEVWKQKSNGRYDLLVSYDICKWSGKLGPKFVEGDRQAPEGFYTVRPGQMNPNSNYYLSFNIGFPNAYDKAHGRTGQHLMVHGACTSSGCYSMNDAQVGQIYAMAREAFKGGQREFQIQAFPFRMTADNMARYKGDPNYEFWSMLKEGYDHFEITKVPPKVDVCEKRYVFNRETEPGRTFSPNGVCPTATQPEALLTAYQTYTSKYEAAFTAAAGGAASKLAPKPSIGGVKEAVLVAAWSKARALGQRVPVEPPTLNADGSVTQTALMGRIDSAAGRKMAALEAKQAQADLEKAQAEAAKVAASLPETVPAPEAVQTIAESTTPEQAATATAAPPSEIPSGFLNRLRKRITGG